MSSLQETIKDMLLQEAVKTADLKRVGVLAARYFTKQLGKRVVFVPGLEYFANKYGKKQVGIRLFIGKEATVRLNWETVGKINSKVLSSMDVIKKHGQKGIHVEFDTAQSLVKSLPIAIDVLQGDIKANEGKVMYVAESAEGQDWASAVTSILSEQYLMEARGVTITQDDVKKMLGSIKPGMKIGPFYSQYGVIARKVFDVLKVDQPELFGKEGLAITFKGKPEKVNYASLFDKIGAVSATFSPTDTAEKSLNSPEDTQIENDSERIVFEDQLKDLISITKLLLSGAAYSMFVAGKGGIGKTYNIEKTLDEAGLRDGEGFFKITGTASPVAIYRTLYDNRNGIVLFDDCDGALGDQDARNIIKAATDTKKVRKIAYMKKASWLYNPDFEGDREEDDGENYPSFFDFKGKIIFISNLPLNKLDPDGALRTRSFVVNVDPTDVELLEFMKKISGAIPLEDGLSLSDEERKQTVDVIGKGGRKGDLSIRKLVRALNIRASGVEDWERLVRLVRLYA